MTEGIGAKGLKTKLIINYLPQSMTDGEFTSLFSAIGDLVSSKVMRDNATNYSFGYGFIDYCRPSDAEAAISKLNGYKIFNKTLRVAYSKPPGSSKNVNLYISGLTYDIDEKKLEEIFSPYGELVYTRILRNQDGSSRSVGFVLFKEKDNADAAIRGLQGHTDGKGMKLHIKYAKDSADQHKTHPKFQEYIQQKFMQPSQPFFNNGGMGFQQIPSQQVGYQDAYGGGYHSQVNYGVGGDGGQKAMRGRDVSARYNPISRPLGGGGAGVGGMGVGIGMGIGGSMDNSTATVLFCYNIKQDATDADLYALFSKYGRITKVDVVEGKGYGFVHMPIPFEANEAMMALNGSFHNGKILQVSIKTKKT